MGVNNLPGVATQQCTGRESNLQPLDQKSNALHYTIEPYCILFIVCLSCLFFSLYIIVREYVFYVFLKIQKNATFYVFLKCHDKKT